MEQSYVTCNLNLIYDENLQIYTSQAEKGNFNIVYGLLPLVCAVYLRYTLLKFYFTF